MADEAEKLPKWLGWVRVAIGLAQGFALYWFDQTKDTIAPLHQGLFYVALLTPIILIGGIRAMRPLTLAAWAVVATLVVFWIGWHDVARLGDVDPETTRYRMTAAPWIAAIIVFVGHHLVQAADNANTWIAPYEGYFDLGWRHGAQLALSALFTLAFWLVLWLGAALFNLIKLDFLQNLLAHTWFAFPAICASFAAAIHLTELRSGLVRGVRALGLVLLSWLLPVMTAFAGAFLVALCFTGLKPLWDTRAATTILMTAAGALVVLINATYQDGMKEPPPMAVMAWAARIAGVLMTPIALLAAYALYLRIAQYGFTPERVFALAVLVIGSCYAVTYMVAAFWPRWMQPLERGNIASAFVVIGVAIALFTPIADPARVSVDDQMRRIRAGLTPADHIDWDFLRFSAVRYGHDALVALQRDQATPAARRLSQAAATALAQRYVSDREVATRAPQLVMHPAGVSSPRNLDLGTDPAAYICGNRGCDGFLVDVNNDSKPELVLIDKAGAVIWVYEGDAAHAWRWIAQGVSGGDGQALRDGVAASRVRAVPPQLNDLAIGTTTITLEARDRP